MQLHQFVKWADHGGHPTCYLMRRAEGLGYVLEIEMSHNREVVLDKRDHPISFTSLDEAERFLLKHGIHQAELVLDLPYDEMVGEEPFQGDGLQTIPLRF